MSSGGCIREYKNQPNYGNINLRIGLRSVHISFMKTHPNYIPSRQHEFDIGIMRVSNFTYLKGVSAKYTENQEPEGVHS